MKALLAASVIAALTLAACGSSSSSNTRSQGATSTAAPATPGSTVSLSAPSDGTLKFVPSTASARAGNVTLTLHNPAPVTHGIAIEANGVTKTGPTVAQGGSSSITVSLKPGTYTFFCPVPGHRQAGMQGTLTVTAAG